MEKEKLMKVKIIMKKMEKNKRNKLQQFACNR